MYQILSVAHLVFTQLTQLVLKYLANTKPTGDFVLIIRKNMYMYLLVIMLPGFQSQSRSLHCVWAIYNDLFRRVVTPNGGEK